MSDSGSVEETIFLSARQLSHPDERAVYLDNACGDDRALRDRVERLLNAEQNANQFLANNPLELDEATVLRIAGSETVGSMVGRYKLLEKIGEGGCGVVYMAEQEEPVRRRVALKIIKLGMDTRQVVARFEAERQALAMMDHPNIAKVFDGGVTGDSSGSPLSTVYSQLPPGRPYFVMELVRGIRITEYCDQNHLSTRERLDLFIKTAHAIQHAHQKGIIHRDIKPSNVLVTLHDGVPVPKVIDFGIAKATEQRLTDKTLFTQFEQFIGTPAYTSPEQAEMSGLDIDTRTDIYGLGVLLYELLVGKTPFDTKELQKSGLAEMRRIIREQEPARPSTRLSTMLAGERRTAAQHRGASAPELIHVLKGDLDWIVMKCLEKDRTRRYETASALAADIRHYLGNEPVTARPPGNFYRFGKLVRRNRLVCASVAAVAMALLAGIVVSTWQATRARQAEQESIAEGESARTVMDFFRRHLLGAGAPAADDGDKKTRLRKALAAAEEEVTAAFSDRPLVEADIRSTLGSSCAQLEEWGLAAPQHERALTLLKKELGPEHPRTVETMFDLAMAYNFSQNPSGAVPLFEKTLQWQKATLGSDHAETLYTMSELAWAYSRTNRIERSLSLLEETLKLARARLGSQGALRHHIMFDLAVVCEAAGRLDQALSLLEEVTTEQAKGGGVYRDFAYKLGCVHRKLGNLDQAIPPLRKAYSLLIEQLGSEHSTTRQCGKELGWALRDAGKLDELETWYREELRKNPKSLFALAGLGVLLLESRTSGSESATSARDEQAKEAERYLADYLASLRSRYANNPFELECALYGDLADPLYRIQRFARGEPLFREMVQSRRSRMEAENPHVLFVKEDLARLLSDWAWAERGANPVAAEVTRLTSSHSQPSTLNPQPSPRERAREAEQLLRECLAIRERIDAGSLRIPDVKNRLGSALVSVAVTDPALNGEARQAMLTEAESLLLESHPAMGKPGMNISGIEFEFKRDSLQRLVRLYEAWDKPDKRVEWQQALEALDKNKRVETMSDYTSIEEGPGSMVGRYKLLQKIGEGGCGVVYMAEQEEPVRRRVALKIIKLGMDTREVVARFEAERQALAMMDHPNIARVFDAGATDAGRPYFVMELVRGIRITEYCDQNHLSTRERLDLFIHTAHAIQHAHQKGIIHRDIKPSNVLVTLHDGVPVPKVIDFGIAKATEQRLTDKTLFTQFEQFIGTPAYTSPEQAEMSGLDIDTRTDIYGLGVLLYELLVGKTPFDQKDLLAAGLDEMRRTIREVDPVKPSTRLTQLLRARGNGNREAKSSSFDHKSSIDHDLDWIVMKCLEKDRTRRYETASGLAADIRHYLGNEPVTARPPGNFYRFGKLVRRNKLACAAGAAVAMALIVGMIVSLEHASRARRAQQSAKTDGDSARAVMDFFRHQVLAPWRVGEVRSAGGGRDEGALRKAIEGAESKIAGAFKDRPQVEADIRSTLGASYSRVEEHALAARQYEAALTLFKKLHGPRHQRTLECMRDLGEAYLYSGKFEPAVPLLEATLELQRASLGSDHVEVVTTMWEMAWAYWLAGSVEQSLSLFEDILKRRQINPGPDHEQTLDTMRTLAQRYLDAGKPEPALRLYEIIVTRTKGKPEVQDTADRFNLGFAHSKLGQFDQAIPMMQEALTRLKMKLGPNHPTTIEKGRHLAEAYRDAGKLKQLEAWCREELKSDHAVPSAQLGLGVLLMESVTSNEESNNPSPDDAARSKEAEQLLAEYLAGIRSRYAKEPERLERHLIADVAEPLYRIRHFAMAEPLYREVRESRLARHGAGHNDVVAVTASLARVLSDWAWAERNKKSERRNQKSETAGRAREAEQLLRDCLAIRLRGSDTDPWRISEMKGRLGSALVSAAVTDPALNAEARLAKLAEAEPLVLEGHAQLQTMSVERKYRRDALVRLVRLYEACDQPDKRAEWQQKLDEFDRKK